MRLRSVLALIFLAVPAAAETAEETGVFLWERPEEEFGGFSGLELSVDGSTFTAVTDSAAIYRGRLLRSNGAITGVEVLAQDVLSGGKGEPLSDDDSDAEGLAVGEGNIFYVSFERRHRIVAYGKGVEELPAPRDFSGLQNNSGLEALAADHRGRIYAIPERSGHLYRPFPVYRYDPETGRWDIPFRLSRRGDYLPTGADVGPDGRLYVLERAFHGVIGFGSRLRVFPLSAHGVQEGVTLMETRPGERDNLEAVSVWRDHDGGIRITVISDDNFFALQRTEIVEYRLLP